MFLLQNISIEGNTLAILSLFVNTFADGNQGRASCFPRFYSRHKEIISSIIYIPSGLLFLFSTVISSPEMFNTGARLIKLDIYIILETIFIAIV